MARASHRADRSPVLSSSCLVSSHLISLPLLSTVHRCLCSAQQFGTFRVTVSRLLYHLRAIIYHLRAAHTHTQHHEKDSLLLSICDVDFPPEDLNPSSLHDETRADESFCRVFLLFFDRGFYILLPRLTISYNIKIFTIAQEN